MDFTREILKLGEFGEIVIYVQRYKCTECGKRYSAKIDGIVREKHWYCDLLKKMANSVARIMKYSGRKIQQLFLALFGVAPSHQTIENWLEAETPRVLKEEISQFQYSGYYAFDEQYVRIKGKRAYRLTLFDVGYNVPVAEEVTSTLTKEVVKAFLKINLEGQSIYAITSDDRKFYREMVRELKAVHQLCAFHFLKKVREDSDWYFKRRSISDAEKIRIALSVSCIHEIFRSFTVEEFREKLEKVTNTMDSLPLRMKKHIKKLVKDSDFYTSCFLNPCIPKTTSQLENYYRQTDPQKMKKRYKIPPGLTRALYQKAPSWIVRNGFISEEDSLRIAQKYLGTHYNTENIHKMFSPKKKHVLKYWFSDPAD